LPQQQVSKTLWNEEEQSKEEEMMKVMQSDGVWTEMEEGFKAHQLVVNLMGMGFCTSFWPETNRVQQLGKNVRSSRVFSTHKRRNVSVCALWCQLPRIWLNDRVLEILIQRVKQLEPEEIARKVQQFDQDLCTQVFLSELKPVLPTPEQVGI
jgi:cytokinesis protein